MATINLDNGYRLKSDSRQWILQKRRADDEEGNQRWSSEAFHVTLQDAVRASYARFIRESEAEGIVDFMDESVRIFNNMVRCLSPVMEIQESA